MIGSLHFRAPGIEQYLDQRPMDLAGAFQRGYGNGLRARELDMRETAAEQATDERAQARTEAAQMRYGPDLVMSPEGGIDFGASEAARWSRAARAEEAQRMAELQDYEMRRQADLELAKERAIMSELFRPAPTPPAPRPPDRPFEGTREGPGGGKQTGKFATQEELDAFMRAGGGAESFGLDEWQRAQNMIDAAEVGGDKVKVVVDPDTGQVGITEAGWFGLGGMTPADARKRIEELRRRRGGGLTPPAPEAATGTNRPVRRFDYRALQMLPSGQ